MIGSWKWNVLASIFAAGLIFLISYPNNPLETTLYRTSVSFIILFAVTYAVRWMLGQAVHTDRKQQPQGRHIDFITPNEMAASSDHTEQEPARPSDSPNETGVPETSEGDTEFAPLTPPKLVRTAETPDPELTAEAIRRLAKK